MIIKILYLYLQGTSICMVLEIFNEEVYSEANDVYSFIVYEIFMLETP